MKQTQLTNALSAIKDEGAIIKGMFTFDREYSAAYLCHVENVTLSYSKDGAWEITLNFVEDTDPNKKSTITGEGTAVSPAMTKANLLAVLAVLAEENPTINATFEFADRWGSSYTADVVGIQLSFNAHGSEAVIVVKESKKADATTAAEAAA